MGWFDSWGGDSGGDSGGGGGDGWGTLLSAIIGGVSSYSGSKEDQKIEKDKNKYAIEALREQGAQNRITSQYESGLADYYRQLERQRKRDGYGQFGQFARNKYQPQPTPERVGAPPALPGMGPVEAPLPTQAATTGGGLAGVARGY